MEEAANADQALALFGQNPRDVVLLDFNMPGQDGLTLAEELRDLNPKVRVATISANRQAEIVNRAQVAGTTFLPKPLVQEALSAFLKAARPHPMGG